VEVEPARLVDARGGNALVARHVPPAYAAERDVVEAAVYLISRCEHQRRPVLRGADRLQDVQRSAGIYHEVAERIVQAGRHGDLRREVKDPAGTLHRGA